MAIEINGLPLPVALVGALQDGRWRKPAKVEAWQGLFPGHNANHAMLYDLRLMEKENATWRLDSSNRYYLGKKNESRPPGDIDPGRSVLIADLEPEKTIALDYRESLVRPSVVYLAHNLDGSTQWIRIAPDIETFIRALGLEAVESRTG